MRALSILFFLLAFQVMASNTKIQKSLYEKIPIQLRKFLPMIAFNAYNTLNAEQRVKVTEIAKEYQSTKDINRFFQEIIPVSPSFAKQIIYVHHLRSLAIAAEVDEEHKEKVRGAADAAFNLGVSLLSGDQAYQKEAQAEADKYNM